MPDFRARVVTLLATHPHVIDMMGLKKDVAYENGICYWSSLSSADSKCAAAHAAHDQPWDMRSWRLHPGSCASGVYYSERRHGSRVVGSGLEKTWSWYDIGVNQS
jgi:hypothetical protein